LQFHSFQTLRTRSCREMNFLPEVSFLLLHLLKKVNVPFICQQIQTCRFSRVIKRDEKINRVSSPHFAWFDLHPKPLLRLACELSL